jgi:hypothetical protein
VPFASLTLNQIRETDSCRGIISGLRSSRGPPANGRTPAMLIRRQQRPPCSERGHRTTYEWPTAPTGGRAARELQRVVPRCVHQSVACRGPFVANVGNSVIPRRSVHHHCQATVGYSRKATTAWASLTAQEGDGDLSVDAITGSCGRDNRVVRAGFMTVDSGLHALTGPAHHCGRVGLPPALPVTLDDQLSTMKGHPRVVRSRPKPGGSRRSRCPPSRDRISTRSSFRMVTCSA